MCGTLHTGAFDHRCDELGNRVQTLTSHYGKVREACVVVWSRTHVLVATHPYPESGIHRKRVLPDYVSKLAVRAHQHVDTIVVPRQFALHLDAEGTLENENLHDGFLRTILRAKRVAAFFYHRNPVN